MRTQSITFKMLAGTFMVFGLVTAFALQSSASAISLKQSSVIEGNSIMLGDVFNGLPANSDKVLGPAPMPGHDMVLNARTLLRIAVAMDLPWRPSTNGDYVVLTRAGMVIEQDTVKDAVSEQLAAQGITGKYALGFTSSFPQVVLPADMAQQVEVSSLVAKPEKNIFEATIAAPSQANPVQTFRIIGTMHRLIEVPVLSETLDRGMIIGARDIQMIEMREDSLKNGMVVSAQSLIGMTPRRMIVSGQPVDLSSVEPPRSVERGDLVTMVFQDGPLTLTAQAKAMENGATGDVIRVVNVSSNKTLEAEVTASKEVTVKNF